ncbi:MAG: UbiA family prenyltransferase [Pseudomonadota bacterium]
MPANTVRRASPARNDWGALLLLLSMPFVAGVCVISVQIYLGEGVKPLTVVMVAALALFIYALNGLSDGAEDAINDERRAATLRANAWWTLGVSSLAVVVAGVLLLLRGRLHLLYPILMLVGVAYSFRVIPAFSGSGLRRFRLKDVPFVKNLSIGCTWAGAVFLGPLLDTEGTRHSFGRLAILGASYAIIAVENSMFCDLRDELGDREAGVRTVVGYLGRSRTFTAIFVSNLLWSTLVGTSFAFAIVNGATAAFLTVLAIGYPFAVWLATERFAVRRGVANGIIESSAVIFALGLVVLGLC